MGAPSLPAARPRSGTMTDDDDLRLNTLHRFRKHSENLVLEEHGHCEVPAGCGGAIITWRNPQVALPVLLYLACPGRCRVYVDDRVMHSGRLELSFGTRHLTFHLSEFSDGPRLFAAVARVDLRAGYDTGPVLPGARTVADGSWLMARTKPGHDTDWQPLAASGADASIPESHSWVFGRATDNGADILACPTTPMRCGCAPRSRSSAPRPETRRDAAGRQSRSRHR